MKTDSTPSGASPIIPILPVVLNVPLYGQQTTLWCWAASTQMALQYIGISVEQCAEANQLFNFSNCCDTPTPTECIRGGSPQLAYWGASADATPKGTALSFAQLQAQIDANMPVIYSWKWIVKGGHVMVAVGYYAPAGAQLVFVNNPWPPNVGDQQIITYADYVQNPNKPHAHTHGIDHYNIAVATAAVKPMLAPQAMSNPPKAPLYADPIAAATAGLQMAYVLLKHGHALPTDATYSLTAPEQLTLGTPIPVRTVDYARLVEYDGHTDPKNLFETEESQLYPVQLGNKTVSAVWLRPEDGQWAINSAGNLNSITHIQAGLQRLPDAAQAYVVHIPWLDQLFLAHETAGQTQVTHLYTDERLGFAANATQPATEVFKKLAPMAQGLDDLWEGQL